MPRANSKNKELAPQRLDRLRVILRGAQVVRVDDLCGQLGVSPATVRRDLESLEGLGEVRRVHGGAVRIAASFEEPLFDDKAHIARKEKQCIAEQALKMVRPRDTLYLDGGSTVLELARLLRDRGNLTVVTNSLRAAQELSGAGPKLFMVGGEFRRLSQTLVGPTTRLTLEGLNIDKAFMGTLGLTVEEGLTTTDAAEAYTKELVMGRAREVIVLADSSKIGEVLLARSGGWEDVDSLITDKRAGAKFARQMKKQGVKVIRA